MRRQRTLTRWPFWNIEMDVRYATEKLGGQVTGLVVGSADEVQAVLPNARKYVPFSYYRVLS